MKKKILLRLSVIVLACILILPLFSSCGMSSDRLDYIDYMEENCVRWTLSEDGTKLSKGEKVYESIKTDAVLDPIYAYCYYNTVFFEEEDIYSAPEGPGKEGDSEIVWLCGNFDGDCGVYATEKGSAALREFENGKYYAATLISPELAWNYVDLSLLSEADSELEKAETKREADVTELKDTERLEIRVYDSTESFYKAYGGLYKIEGSWYYVNYDLLGNEHFDADGNFSYRRGKVELVKLSAKLENKINTADKNKEILHTVYTYEGDEHMKYSEYKESDYTVAEAVFWVFYSLICLVLPVAIGLGAFALARLEKLGRPKYWYVVSLIAAVWILLSVILMIVMLI